MVEQDYYELLGVAARRRRRDDQGRLSQAGDGMPSRPPRRLHRQGSAVQGDQRAYDSSRTRRSAPPTTASAMPRSRTAAAAIRSAAGGGFDGFSDIFSIDLRRVHGPARRSGQNAARGADLRYDLELTLEEAFAGAEKTITDRGAGARAKPATAAAAQGRATARAPARPAAARARSARSRASSWSSAAARPAAASAR